jgi:hypothetical protein
LVGGRTGGLLDEKSVTLHAEVRKAFPMQPGRAVRRDHGYQLCGAPNVFCGVEGKAGVYFTKVTANRCSPAFADYPREIAARYPEADTIHLVLDNLSSHSRKALVERFGEKAGDWLWNRFTVHYTPKHGSWLHQAEIEIDRVHVTVQLSTSSRVISSAASISAHTRPAYRSNSARENTPDAKLRKLHFVPQNGTEM